MRLTHTNVTARSPAGKSRTQVGRLYATALAPRRRAPARRGRRFDRVLDLAVTLRDRNTAMPASPSIAVALLFSITWGLSVRVP